MALVRPLVLLLALAGLLAPTGAAAHTGHAHPTATERAVPEPAHEDSIAELDFDFAGVVDDAQASMATTAASPLPLTWCGTQRTTDDAANAAHPSSLPQFKLVYAYAGDRGNRFAQWQDLLQANVSLISQFMAQQSGNRKAPRWDMGTPCGPDYVDIETVALSDRATYRENFNGLRRAVDAALDAPGGPRNVVVLADQLGGTDLDALYGQGSIWTGPDGWRPDSANRNNDGGAMSVIWVPDGYTPATSSSQGYWPEGFVHEMSHNVGAVQWSSPHTSSSHPRSSIYSHCWDGFDVMCYADGPQMGHAYETSRCSYGAAPFPRIYDCGRDDYFDPAPAAGSYLDTHWNVHDSVFHADCATLLGACGALSGPQATAAPTVSGAAKVGQTLTATAGAWPEATVALQWQRQGADGNWTDIAGATGTTYVPVAADANASLRVRVTATDATGTSTADAVPTEPVEPGSGVPVNTYPPVIAESNDGWQRRGRTLIAHKNSWTGGPAFVVRWQRLDETTKTWATIATGDSYVVQAGDVDRFLRIQVTATNAAGTTVATSSSHQVALDAAPGPTGTRAPAIGGRVRTGATVTADDGGPLGATGVEIRWMRQDAAGWVQVDSGASHTLSTADQGRFLRLEVVATNAQGALVSRSVDHYVRAPAAPTFSAYPTVSGVADVGATLTATAATWDDADTVSRTWQRYASGVWTDIEGATGATYFVAEADRGLWLRVRERAANVDGTSTATSADIGPIGGPPPASSAAPTISGVSRQGRTLTASEGTWTNATSYAYRWERWVSASGAYTPVGSGKTFTPGQAEANAWLRVVVTATGPGGSRSASSSDTYVTAATPPVNTAAPTVSGTAKDGRTLTATTGTWSNSPSYAHRWERLQDGTWTAIPGATAATRTLGPDDVGRSVRVVVVATNADGSAEAASAAAGPVAALQPPALAGSVTVSGSAVRTAALTASAGWSGHTSVSWRWERETGGLWSSIPGATAISYTLTADDVTRRVRVVSTAVNADGSTVETSAPVGPVGEPPAPQASTAPSVSGTPRRTLTLTADRGAWTGASAYAYRWERRSAGTWSAIAGATAATYTPGYDDLGKPLRVVVTATGAGGSTAEPSAATAPVEGLDPPVNASAPTVAGAAKRTRALTAAPGAWSGSPTYAYRWERRSDGVWTPITGATAASYTATAADLSLALRVVVRATNLDGAAEAASAATSPVADLQPPVLSGAATVSGTPERGAVLRVSASWTGADSTSHRWERESGGAWSAIPGATGAAYTPVAADIGLRVRAVVTAANADGTTAATSAPAGPVADSPAPVNLAAPTVAGTAKRGRILTASRGSWSGATGYAYRWERQTSDGWAAIAGAAGAELQLGAADVGHALRVVVTATAGEHATAAVSEPSGVVADLAPPVSATSPLLAGTPQAGGSLGAQPGDWTGHWFLQVMWEREGADGAWVPTGVAGWTYALTDADVGRRLRVAITAGNGDGETTARSAPSGVVAERPRLDPVPLPIDPYRPPVPPPAPTPTPFPSPTATPDPDAGGEAPAPQPIRLVVRTGRVAALSLTASPTATGVALQLEGVRTKLRDGRYAFQACVGRRCVKGAVTVKRGRATLKRTAVRITPGARLEVRVTGRGVRSAARGVYAGR